MNYFTNEELIEIENLKNNNNFKFYYKSELIEPETIQDLFENNTNEKTSISNVILEKYNKWIEFFRISLLVNCGFVSYDEKSNDQLRGLINSFNDFKLN
jgi:hypothetical protein